MAFCARKRIRQAVFSVCLSAAAFPLLCAAQPAPAAARQIAADQRAYRTARDLSDAGQRVDALLTFVKKYPESVYTEYARQLALSTLLAEFPGRVAEIDETARAIVQGQNKGYDRWNQQMHTADELAGGGPSGVDLPLASAWIADTQKQLTEPHFLEAQKELYRRLDAPLPAAAELHRRYQHKHAEVLLVLAHVAIKQGRVPEATAWLDESAALEPLSGELHYLRGEIALQQHRNAEALELFERANLLGELPAAQRKAMLSLYREAHGGSESGLETDLDKLYATLHPAPFQPAARNPGQAGHTALFELYTGASCGPCVGADLALDALLGSYSRNELVALSFDEHVPLPDPLANPATAARAEVFGVRSTPAYVLNGRVRHLYGTGREGAAALYEHLSQLLDAEIARPGAVHIRLGDAKLVQQDLTAEVEVKVEPESVLRASLATDPADDENEDDEGPTGEAAASSESAPLPRLSLVYALVEDQVRYSGENGVRFHRMVVRAIDRAGNVTLKPGTSTTATVRFRPDQIAEANASYLEAYEKKNDRFGPVKFLSRDTAMKTANLSLAAWVEDAATHRVLQAAFVPVQPSMPAEQKP